MAMVSYGNPRYLLGLVQYKYRGSSLLTYEPAYLATRGMTGQSEPDRIDSLTRLVTQRESVYSTTASDPIQYHTTLHSFLPHPPFMDPPPPPTLPPLPTYSPLPLPLPRPRPRPAKGDGRDETRRPNTERPPLPPHRLPFLFSSAPSPSLPCNQNT
ncbi:hypothetical protein WAI453_008159 [Rhynchosporium graminicola]